MKTLFRHVLTVALSLTLLTSTATAGSNYQFKFNHQDRSGDEATHKPKVVDAGEMTVNGVRMAAFHTTFENPREMGVLTFRAKPIKAKIKAEYLKQFDLYGMPNGSVFVPEGWKLVYGGVGKNASLSYTFIPPVESDGYLTFYHTSGCVSCAMTNASLFFSQAVKDAKEHDFEYYTSTNMPLNVVSLKQNLVAYSIEQNNNRIDGLAYYNPHSELPFWKVEVSLPQSHSHLANALLNQFLTKYNR